MRASIAIVVVAAAIGCGSQEVVQGDCSPGATLPRDEQWRTDLRCAVSTIKASHPAPYANISEAELDQAVRALDDSIPSLTDPQVEVAMMALVARLRDGHTYVVGTGWTPLALRFRRFPEGIFVVGAAAGLEAWLGSRVLAIGGVPIEEARARVAPLIPQENEQTVASREADLLGAIDVLQGIGAADPTGSEAGLQLETSAGAAFPRIGVMNGSPVTYPAARPRSLTRVDVNYWYEIDAATRTLYLQYNACSERKDLPMAEFAAQVQQALSGADRAIVDLRWNGGGATSVNLPLERAFRAWAGSGDPDRLLVLIGPQTFSAAISAALDFRTTTSARLIGETAGGNPNGFGNILLRTLPYSGLRLQYSTRAFHLTDDPANRLAPDRVVVWGWSDYAAGIDPLLVAAGMSGR